MVIRKTHASPVEAELRFAAHFLVGLAVGGPPAFQACRSRERRIDFFRGSADRYLVLELRHGGFLLSRIDELGETAVDHKF
jgi:hypothetical protein